MRSEWETVRLSDVCDLVAGFAFKSKDFGSFEDKVIKITHIVPPTVAMDSLVGVNWDDMSQVLVIMFWQ